MVQIHNDSDVTYVLRPETEDPDLSFPGEVRLPGGKTALLQVRGRAEDRQAERVVNLLCAVTNLLVRPNVPLKAAIEFNVTLLPK